MLNVQETLELKYFQKLQVLKQELSVLKREKGELESEVEHYKYLLGRQQSEEDKAIAIEVKKERLYEDQRNQNRILQKQNKKLLEDNTELRNQFIYYKFKYDEYITRNSEIGPREGL